MYQHGPLANARLKPAQASVHLEPYPNASIPAPPSSFAGLQPPLSLLRSNSGRSALRRAWALRRLPRPRRAPVPAPRPEGSKPFSGSSSGSNRGLSFLHGPRRLRLGIRLLLFAFFFRRKIGGRWVSKDYLGVSCLFSLFVSNLNTHFECAKIKRLYTLQSQEGDSLLRPRCNPAKASSTEPKPDS